MIGSNDGGRGFEQKLWFRESWGFEFEPHDHFLRAKITNPTTRGWQSFATCTQLNRVVPRSSLEFFKIQKHPKPKTLPPHHAAALEPPSMSHSNWRQYSFPTNPLAMRPMYLCPSPKRRLASVFLVVPILLGMNHNVTQIYKWLLVMDICHCTCHIDYREPSRPFGAHH